MRKILLILLLISIPILGYTWTDSTGSTQTATTTDYDVNDIVNKVYDSTNEMIKTVLSSPTADVTIYHGESLPTGSNVIGGVITSSPTADVTIYHGEALPAGTNNIGDVDILSLTSSSPTANFTMYHGESLPAGNNNIGIVSNPKYYGKTSTGTAGILTSTGDIPNTTYNVFICSLYLEGGNGQATASWLGSGSVISLLEGIPKDIIPVYPVENPTISISSLDSGTSVHYEVEGN